MIFKFTEAHSSIELCYVLMLIHIVNDNNKFMINPIIIWYDRIIYIGWSHNLKCWAVRMPFDNKILWYRNIWPENIQFIESHLSYVKRIVSLRSVMDPFRSIPFNSIHRQFVVMCTTSTGCAVVIKCFLSLCYRSLSCN